MDNQEYCHNSNNGVYAKTEIATQRSVDTAFTAINDNLNSLKASQANESIQSDIRDVSNNVSEVGTNVAKDVADLAMDNTKSFYSATVAQQAGFNELTSQLTGLGYSVSDKSALIMQELCKCCGDTKLALTLLQMQLSKEIQDTASEQRLADLTNYHNLTTQATSIANAQTVQATANQSALVTLITANQNALLNKMNEDQLSDAQARVAELTSQVTRMNDNANTERIIANINSNCHNGRRHGYDDINFYNNDSNVNTNTNKARANT